MTEPRDHANIIYRATVPGGREVELRLVLDAKTVNIADGWARLTRAFGFVDPASVEIEIRPTSTIWPFPAPARGFRPQRPPAAIVPLPMVRRS